jgi:heptosyltransferase II
LLVLRPGGMGDLIMAQLTLEAWGATEVETEWVVERRSENWARFAGLKYHCYDRAAVATFWRLRGRYGTVINTEQRYGLSQAFALGCLRPGGRLWSFETNRAGVLGGTVPYDWKEEHESRAFHRLFAAALNLPMNTAGLRRSRRQPATGPRVIGLAGLEAESRHLNEQQYADLVRPWLGDESALICCAPRDRPFAQRLARQWPEQMWVFDGDFGAMCREIARATAVFCMDGGMVHIASYFGVPATVIFTSGRTAKWAPLAVGSSVVQRKDLPCQPCTVFGQVPPCPHQYACKQLSYAEHFRLLP